MCRLEILFPIKCPWLTEDIESNTTTLLFTMNTVLLTYNFYKAWKKDPGFIKTNRDEQIKVNIAFLYISM